MVVFCMVFVFGVGLVFLAGAPGVFIRVAIELARAGRGAEIEGLPLELPCLSGCRWFEFHSAYRISYFHPLSLTAMAGVVVVFRIMSVVVVKTSQGQADGDVDHRTQHCKAQ